MFCNHFNLKKKLICKSGGQLQPVYFDMSFDFVVYVSLAFFTNVFLLFYPLLLMVKSNHGLNSARNISPI